MTAMSDPYRDAATEACPTCATPLVIARAGELRPCPRGCGEWADAALVAERWGSAIDVDGDPRLRWRSGRAAAPCIVCRKPMRNTVHPSWTVHHCHDHGAWFETDARARFEQQLAARIGQHRAERLEEAQMLELVAAAVTGNPAAVRGLANRLLELERALRRLRESGVPV